MHETAPVGRRSVGERAHLAVDMVGEVSVTFVADVTVQDVRAAEALQNKINAIRRHVKAHKLQQTQRRASCWLSAEQELEGVVQRHGEHSWQHRMVGIIQSHRAQVIIVTLLVLDVIIVFIELYIDAEFPACSLIVRDAVSCCPVASSSDHGSSSLDHHTHRLLLGSASGSGSDSHNHHTLCESPLVDSLAFAAGCDSHKWASVHTAHTALFACSVAILSAFQLELLSLLAALGLSFFRNPLYAIDLLVVATSLCLELVLKSLSNALSELGGLLVVARVWRFLRIAHGLMTSMHEVSHHHIEELEHSVDEMEHEMSVMVDYTARLEAQVPAGTSASLKADAVQSGAARRTEREATVRAAARRQDFSHELSAVSAVS